MFHTTSCKGESRENVGNGHSEGGRSDMLYTSKQDFHASDVHMTQESAWIETIDACILLKAPRIMLVRIVSSVDVVQKHSDLYGRVRHWEILSGRLCCALLELEIQMTTRQALGSKIRRIPGEATVTNWDSCWRELEAASNIAFFVVVYFIIRMLPVDSMR